ncbi:MAG: (d)CMP kinase [Bacteroidota bacterium]
MQKITIAIDGYSSTGKSTIAKHLAKTLDYAYVDTGAMYRAVTLYTLRNDFFVNGEVDVPALTASLPHIELKFVPNTETGQSEIYLNGENAEQEIRTMKISKHVSKVAAIKEVREMLVEMQKAMGKTKGMVMDGRDIGTVVFPDAELKIFMTASPEKRAHRRYKELIDRGQSEVTYAEVLKNVAERDYIDTHRAISPLVKATDAIEFDNSDMGLDEQFERIYRYALRIINRDE